MKSKFEHIKVILHIALVCLAIFVDNLNLGIPDLVFKPNI
jgi:hypothetical protein